MPARSDNTATRTLDAPTLPPARGGPSGRVADLWELTKPGITGLVLVTTAVGFYLASRGSLDLQMLAATLLGTGLLAGGTNALNQYAERGIAGSW